MASRSGAFERYFAAKARKTSLAEDKRIAEHLKAAFGEKTRLRDLTASRIARYKAERLGAKSIRRKDEHGKPKPLSAASINRPLALLRHLLRLAATQWEVIPKAPHITLEREPEAHVCWLESDEKARLLAACAKSQNRDLAAIVELAMETGLRLGEVHGLEWNRIDLTRGVIRVEKSKGKRRREVPMSSRAYDLLAARPEKTGRVWPEADFGTAFENAVEAAKLDRHVNEHGGPFHFHCTRHHFASWYVMDGGDVLVLRDILGHAKVSMTEKYAHLRPAHVRADAAKVEAARAARTATGSVSPPVVGTKGHHEVGNARQVLVKTGAGGGS